MIGRDSKWSLNPQTLWTTLKRVEHVLLILLAQTSNKMIETDIIIIGAGPVGLFTIFEAGLLKLRCHLIDSLPQPGGQCSEIYPKKPIYDIPGFPSILAGELITNLEEQAAPFKPGFTLGEAAVDIEKTEDAK